MVKHLDAHPLFKRLTDEELVRAPPPRTKRSPRSSDHVAFHPLHAHTQVGDVALKHIMHSTEEGIKVERNSGSKYPAVYRRIAPATDA